MSKHFDRFCNLKECLSVVQDCICVVSQLGLDGDIGFASAVDAVQSLRNVASDIRQVIADSTALAHYDKCQSCSMCQEDE